MEGTVNGQPRTIMHFWGDEQNPTYDQVMADAVGHQRNKPLADSGIGRKVLASLQK